VRKNFILGLVLLLSMLACRFSVQTPTPAPTSVPTETPAPTLTPEPTITLTPAPTPTPPLRASGGPALKSIYMFSPLNGWGVIENALLLTHDGGASWASVPLHEAEITASSEVVFINPNILYVLVPGAEGQDARFFATRDSGITWTSNPVPFLSAQLDFINDNNGLAYQVLNADAANTAVAIYLTYDRGVTWQLAFSHATAPSAENLPVAGAKTGMSFIDSSQGWIGLAAAENEIGLYRSPDSGRTWIKQQMAAPANHAAFTATAYPPFVFRDNNADAFLPVDFIFPGVDGSTRTFYVTQDAGHTWAEAASVPDGAAYTFINPQTGWAWGGHSLYFTSDAAQTWTALPVAFSRNEHAACINFVNQNDGWLITVDLKNRVHMYNSHDGGNTWTAIIP
jgi:photosystem II stability/assembly factor-like uncharacterized protein